MKPLKNHLYVKDYEPVRKIGSLYLPDASTGHGGLIRSMSTWRIGEVLAVGNLTSKYTDLVEQGDKILYSFTAGKKIDKENKDDPQYRIVHVCEAQARLTGTDPTGLEII